MGDYQGGAAIRLGAGAVPSALYKFSASLSFAAVTLAVGRSKQTLTVQGLRAGDLPLLFALSALPGNVSIADAIVTGANTIDVYLQNTVLLSAGAAATVPISILVFRKQ